MKKLSISSIIITVLALVAIAWLVVAHVHKKTTPPTPATPSSTATSPSSTPQALWPSQRVKDDTIKESTTSYDITATYPVTQDAHIAATIKSFIDDQVSQFKQDTSWASDPNAPTSAAAGSLSLNIDYKEEKSTSVDTYVFTIDSYTGGAHGLEVTRTLAYDNLGNPIGVDDLFNNGANGLQVIADYVENQLIKGGADASWVKQGAGPSADNYQNFIVSDTGITFIFDPYQVAAYAAGSQNITVPLSVFKSVANPSLFPTH
ncbi:MAG TPA: DUF3298 domain-containing protein [Candidatus Paceibacterota bacterium]|nr:DUF3298 domain-containing protein [Candidatus Paceibacterota bacterium]